MHGFVSKRKNVMRRFQNLGSIRQSGVMTDTTDGVSPQMLAALLHRAEPDLRAAKADLDAAVQAGRELERRLASTRTVDSAE